MPKVSLKKSSVISLLTGTFILSGILSGCVPPSPNSGSQGEGGGRKILKVEAAPHPAFRTVEKDGVEFRESRGETGKYGGTFVTAEIGDGPKTFNPWASFDATSSSVGGMLCSSLMDTDPYTGEVVPYMAKSYTVDPDHKTYRVTLRKGLEWSDGKPLTAKDVVFTWNEIVGKGLGNSSTRDNLMVDGQFPTAKALDDLTIEFKTPKPFAPFLRQMGGVNIAPEHVFAPIIRKGGDNAFSSAWGTSDAINHPEKFVSSGMWLLDKYDLNERMTFKRNPKFFMMDKAGNRLPYLDKYQILVVKDLNNYQLQFEQGKLDYYGIPGQFVAHVRTQKTPEFVMYDRGPSTGTTFLTFNLNTRKDPETGKSLVDPVHSSWFNNVNFRQAVDWALNRQDMVDNILKGVGKPLFTPESPSSIFLNKKLAEGHTRDLEKAKALLKKGGFSWNDEGQLLDGQKHPVEFTLYTNTGNDQREATGVNIKQDLADLGIKVNFKPMEFNVLVDKMHRGNWEALVMGLTGGILEPHEGANVWKSNGALHLFNQRDNKKLKPGEYPKDRLPWETEIDNIFEQGALAFDMAERRKIYDRYQEVAYEQQPFVYLFAPESIVAMKSRIKNFDPTPINALHNPEEIWIEEENKSEAKK